MAVQNDHRPAKGRITARGADARVTGQEPGRPQPVDRIALVRTRAAALDGDRTVGGAPGIGELRGRHLRSLFLVARRPTPRSTLVVADTAATPMNGA